MKLKFIINSVLIFMILLLLNSCATIVNGTTQDVNITSNPAEAVVLINGLAIGETPMMMEVSRKEGGLIRIEKDGYESVEILLQRDLSGWYFGNIIFGGLIGLILDPINGAAFKLSPDVITVTLETLGGQKDTGSIKTLILPYNRFEGIKEINIETVDDSYYSSVSISLVQ